MRSTARSAFGISQYTTWTLNFADDLRLYRQLGIENVEVCEAKLSSKPERDLLALKELGFNVSSVQPRYHSPFPNSLRKVPADPGERMRRLAASVRLFGRHFPGTTVVVNTGLAPSGDLASAFRIAVREFKKIARHAERHGVRIALEPLQPIYMNTDTFICSLREAIEMIDAVNHPAFGLMLDVWHYAHDPSASALISAHGEKIFGVHISDWRKPRAFGDRLLPGSGELALVEMLGTIRDAGYSGVYTLEIFSDLRLPDSLWRDPAKTAALGQRAFGRVWRQLSASAR